MYKASTGALDVRTLFIATYRNAAYGSNFTPNKSMCVTVEQARLLAMDGFDRLATYALNLPNSLVLLTPLAGSIFSRDDIAKIAQDIGVTPIQVLCAINNSCQSGGQYLNRSSINIAVVASIVATRNIKDEDVAASIVGKTIPS
ncbi:unnamed protein product [Phaedon cochleariae]|uniref:Uncharacterized protein n=1 Tax=Phaedon cochleariae TaxID=80249 RepID=A0A9N9SCL9_PHACE|nr:unnamed protein product [Phaedon cochleariae]